MNPKHRSNSHEPRPNAVNSSTTVHCPTRPWTWILPRARGRRMVLVKPIATCEFIPMLRRCKPPTGWPSKLAIANSGGPDSTCLSFLLDDALRRIQEQDPTHGEEWFRELVSLNVDHQFQSCSSEMSLEASKIPRRLGIPHESLIIPWGSPPYTDKPSPGKPFERIARDARYTLLLSAMRKHEAGAITFGHHADDQLETFLMRLANGTGFFGLGGMKPVRRFGMGDGAPGRMGWYGAEGMRRWIVRPLLGVSKDRVLATCEEHGLEYVTDETNFQPDVTSRNALRHALTVGKLNDAIDHSRTLRKAVTNAERLGVSLSLSNGIESLRTLAGKYTSKIEAIETEAHTLLLGSTVPSPPSTVLLSRDKLARITDPLVQRSMAIQVLKFVSPHPWGSNTAEAFRKSAGLDRIVASLFDNSWGETSEKRFAFSAGSHVLWTPVYINPNGQLKRTKLVPSTDGWTEGWLASRSPPYRSTSGASGSDVDITSLVLDKKPSANHAEVLYDNRFILSLNLRAIPDRIFDQLRTPLGGHRLMVTSVGRYLLPRLVFRSSNGHDVEDIGTPSPAPQVGPVLMDPRGDRHLPEVDWANWRPARVFE